MNIFHKTHICTLDLTFVIQCHLLLYIYSTGGSIGLWNPLRSAPDGVLILSLTLLPSLTPRVASCNINVFFLPRSRKWDNRTTSAADETRKGENGVSNPAFVPDMTYAHAADISYEAPDHRFPHGHEFGPDPKKCTHFDGSICHRMAVMY